MSFERKLTQTIFRCEDFPPGIKSSFPGSQEKLRKFRLFLLKIIVQTPATIKKAIFFHYFDSPTGLQFQPSEIPPAKRLIPKLYFYEGSSDWKKGGSQRDDTVHVSKLLKIIKYVE